MDNLLRKHIVKGAEIVATEAKRIIAPHSRRVEAAIHVEVKGDLISVETDESVDGIARAWAGGLAHPTHAKEPLVRKDGTIKRTWTGKHPRSNYMELAWSRKVEAMQQEMAAWTADLTRKL